MIAVHRDFDVAGVTRFFMRWRDRCFILEPCVGLAPPRSTAAIHSHDLRAAMSIHCGNDQAR